MNDVVFIAVRCIVAACAALLSAYALPCLKRLSQNEQMAAVRDMVEVAVQAAEKTVRGICKGKVKKEMVVAYAWEWLNRHNIRITEEQLDALIESAVYQLT